MASPLRNLGAGLLRGTTADVLGMPIDTLNMMRQNLLSPAQGGNPYARSIAGLLGPTQEVGSSDYFAQQMGLPQGEGLLYEGARMVSPSPTDLMTMARRVPIQELITYHGTPHRFEPTPANPLGEFEASKIGSGEGAQAYGHGVYLAESPGVAGLYQANLSKRGHLPPNPKQFTNLDSGQTFAQINGEYRGPGNKLMTKKEYGEEFKKAQKAWDKTEYAGSLYTADLPDEMIDRMLDWDKPLSEQPKAVREALMKDARLKSLFERGKIDDFYGNAGELYRAIMSQERGNAPMNLAEEAAENWAQAPASQRLRSLGIPGVKYLDQGSRDSGKGTRNFVVFPGEEKKVKILKRD